MRFAPFVAGSLVAGLVDAAGFAVVTGLAVVAGLVAGAGFVVDADVAGEDVLAFAAVAVVVGATALFFPLVAVERVKPEASRGAVVSSVWRDVAPRLSVDDLA